MRDGAAIPPLPARHRWLAISFYGGPDDEVLVELEGVGVLDTARTFTSAAELGAYLQEVLAALFGPSDAASGAVRTVGAAQSAHDRFIDTIRGAIAHCAARLPSSGAPGAGRRPEPGEGA